MYENRYCNQDDFSVLICGGKNKSDIVVDTVYKLDGPEFSCEKYTSLPTLLNGSKIAVVNSDLFVVSGYCVRKFCSKTNTWKCKWQSNTVVKNCSICSFKQNIYVIKYDGSCFYYNFELNKQSKLADMNLSRWFAACTVFEGKIVVTGGFSKSVEAYDHYEYEWAYLPDMIEEIEFNASVSMGNKMYVIGGMSTTNCEIFDSFSRKFTFIKPDIPNYKSSWFSEYQAVAKGNFILIISENKYKDSKDTTMYIFDVQKSQ